jgi:hypothetical protein
LTARPLSLTLEARLALKAAVDRARRERLANHKHAMAIRSKHMRLAEAKKKGK